MPVAWVVACVCLFKAVPGVKEGDGSDWRPLRCNYDGYCVKLSTSFSYPPCFGNTPIEGHNESPLGRPSSKTNIN